MKLSAERSKPHRSFPLRLSPSQRYMAIAVAKTEGVSLNHFISIAIAERLSRLDRDFPGVTGAGRPDESISPEKPDNYPAPRLALLD